MVIWGMFASLICLFNKLADKPSCHFLPKNIFDSVMANTVQFNTQACAEMTINLHQQCSFNGFPNILPQAMACPGILKQ